MDAAIQNRTETLCIGYGETRLGLVVIAMSDRGLAAVLLGKDRPRLQRELADAFPGAKLVEDAADLGDAVAKVTAYIDTPNASLDLPLDLRGSEVELAVWAALRAIPSGETRSYGAIAKELRVPATAQDVGAACAANRLAVVVPCHRVVKADGSISGYRWGVHRKRQLINMEGVA
jgi:AraC family transcriptional regulator, regulatory protein of adaptative response / methylated-DNA-[protein]-cysteine methyltransferase